ncbi:MAG: LysR family transcriptional regulator [Anaerolineales bacterium]|nr:MAG: LysR family transcriptional regulator [Anaerolineales bacterium]
MIVPKYNLWLERDGKVALSAWRIRLLEAIEEMGSITAAAVMMEVPYRRAWQRLHEMEERLGIPLVKTEIGGVGGGGAKLTPKAKDLIARFHRFADGLENEIEARYQRTFAEG